MGSGSSRMGQRPRPPRRRSDGRTGQGLASFLCGGASSSSVPSQVENEPLEASMISSRLHDSVLADNHQSSVKDSAFNFSSENNPPSSTDEHLMSSLNSNGGLKDRSAELRNAETSSFRKCFSESRELVPCLANASSGPDMIRPERTPDGPSTSTKLEHVEPLFPNVDTTLPPVFVADDSTNSYGSLISPVRFSSGMSQLEPGDLPANQTIENPSTEALGIRSSDSTSFSNVSTPSTSWRLLGEEPLHQAGPTGSAFLTSAGSGEQRNGTILHVDVVSISSNILSSDTGELSNHEARRNSRRLFWDAFSRRSSRRNDDYAAILLTTEVNGDPGSHNGSLLDLSEDIFEDDSIYLRRRRHGLNGRSWHSRSEIREQFRGTFNNNSGQTPFCPSGLHPDGTCSCDSLITAEETRARASISRIVLLAEALFEVLDEIHRQPVSLSLSMVSLPAPESVVNSLPLKHHTKLDSGGAVDVEQCYICLAEYEEGDNIRVLPCRHEYHMPCVDKWLKEIHGVCPLCRRDVCEAAAEDPTSNP